MAERPAYWAVIPASVRYDQDLPPNAKLLYGEVTALSDKRGYCYAQNGYFSELFSLSERSITRLFAVLVDRGYLRVDVIRDESTQEVLERRIYPIYDHGISEPPPDIFVGTPPDIAPQDMDGDYRYSKTGGCGTARAPRRCGPSRRYGSAGYGPEPPGTAQESRYVQRLPRPGRREGRKERGAVDQKERRRLCVLQN